jgi:queuosine precursor transporter
MIFSDKRNIVFTILAGLFITNAVIAELIGTKLIHIGPFIMSIGIIPWPIVFLTTDLINEYYGKEGVKKLSFLTASLVAYAFIVLFFAIKVPAAQGISAVTDEEFFAVFGQSLWIIVGSIVAFLISQFVDVFVFWMLRNQTGGKMIWLRSTGSTVVSQLIDTFVVLGIAFWLPGKMSTDTFINAALTGYTFKLIIAVALTPLIYLGHYLVYKYLGEKTAQKIIEKSAEESLREL